MTIVIRYVQQPIHNGKKKYIYTYTVYRIRKNEYYKNSFKNEFIK